MRIKSLMLGLASMALASISFAAPISTGVANWQAGVGTSTTGNAVVETTIATPYWINNFSDGRWVGVTATDGAYTLPTDGALPGTYTFTLNLNSIVAAGGSFSLQYAADNNVEWTIVGGSISGGTASCTTGDCFSTSNGAPRSLSGTFGNSGAILKATVTNTDTTRTPMGLLVVGTASDVPEPSTYAMLGLGSAAILFARLRRK